MIKTARGFTLIEMAIVLVIITTLIGGLAVPLSAQIQARRIAETKKIMEEAREALLGYAMTHACTCAYSTVGPSGTLLTGSQTTCTTVPSCPTNNPSLTTDTHQQAYLPCPDADGDGNGDDDRNFASRACTPSSGGLAHGWLPWVELGVAQQDAWGNRLLYAVNTIYSNEKSGFSTSTALDNPLQICSTHSCATPDVASNVVFVLASFGPNGWGALNVNGNTLAAPTGADELENKDLTPDSKYVSRTPTRVGGPGGEFDDMLVWVSDSLLKVRVCPTGSDCSP